MAKSQNPMDVFRREQKKKELKKNRVERQHNKKEKIATLDPDELRNKLKTLERQVLIDPTNGPTRKRKQELEDTLNAVLKKRKEMDDANRQAQADAAAAAPKAPMTMHDITEANKAKYQNPQNSVYYHPTLNPFGVPPPGRPQMYHVLPPPPPRPLQRNQHTHSKNRHTQSGFESGRSGPRPMRGGRGGNAVPPQGRLSGHYGPQRGDVSAAPSPPQQPMAPSPASFALPLRRGKRPPLPSGPPPASTIQVPVRPPLPHGAVLLRLPPPPPMALALTPRVDAPAVAIESDAHVADMDDNDADASAAVAMDVDNVDNIVNDDNDDNDDSDNDDSVIAPYPDSSSFDSVDSVGNDDNDDSVVAPYPTTMAAPHNVDADSDNELARHGHHHRDISDDDDDDDAHYMQEAQQKQLRTLVPLALRVQRRRPTGGTRAAAPRVASTMNPAPRPASAMPALAAAAGRAATGTNAQSVVANAQPAAASDGSVSHEFDAFLAEMKSMGAL